MKKALKITALALIVVLAAGILVFAVAMHPWMGHLRQMGDDVYGMYRDDTQTLVIFGHGEMWQESDYGTDQNAVGLFPHYHMATVKRIVVLEGVTKCGSISTFSGPAETIYLPSTMAGQEGSLGPWLSKTQAQTVCLAGAVPEGLSWGANIQVAPDTPVPGFWKLIFFGF